MRSFIAGVVAGFLFLFVVLGLACHMAPRRAPKAPCTIGTPPERVRF